MLQSQNIGFRIPSHLTVSVLRICFSTKVRTLSDIDIHVKEKIEAEEMKPRKHPGAFKLPPVRLPDRVIEAVKKLVTEVPVKNILADSVLFSRYLNSRHLPVEEREILEKKNKFTAEVKERYMAPRSGTMRWLLLLDARWAARPAWYRDMCFHGGMVLGVLLGQSSSTMEIHLLCCMFKVGLQEDKTTEEQKNHYEKVIKGQVQSLMKEHIYNWTRITYTEHNCFLYLFGRAPAEYAVLYRIFREIALRSPDFKPKSLFDFGSGVGTVTWAAQEFWKTSLKEYFNVDACKHMNDLARNIICGGQRAVKMESKGTYYRQFLPSQHIPYDLVVSAFTLFDLPSAKARLDTILNLWQKTEEFLVIVEQGTNAGFKLLLEARDFLLTKYGGEENPNANLHVFAPCPHDLMCPRFLSDNTPCNFELQHVVMPIGQREKTRIERYSYLILKKGKRESKTSGWPRIVRPVIRRSRLTICKLCTAAGKLQDVNFTESKHERIPYRCARGSKWGDLLPMKLKDVIVEDKKQIY